jgi:hypothetical protein
MVAAACSETEAERGEPGGESPASSLVAPVPDEVFIGLRWVGDDVRAVFASVEPNARVAMTAVIRAESLGSGCVVGKSDRYGAKPMEISL